MHVLALEGENFKRLRAVRIEPKGHMVEITGANGHGKTSVLDCILVALRAAGADISEPVRQGAQKGMVRLNLGAGKPELVVTRKFNAAGTTSLTVERADGSLVRSPQTVLDELLGALAFDPLDFARMRGKEQLEQLRALVPLEEDVDKLDAENESDYQARTDLNKQAKSYAAQAEAIQVPQNLPGQPIDITLLMGELERASSHNAGIEGSKSSRAALVRVIEQNKTQAEKARHAAAKYRAEAEAADADAARYDVEAAEGQKRLDESAKLPEVVDVGQIRERISRAQDLNAGLELRDRRRKLQDQRDAFEKSAAELTARMDKRAQRKQEIIAAAKMPVPGLGFGAGEVLFNELPFAQASSAEQLRVSVAIAMAANPKLRVLRITDGSLLDEASMKLLSDLVKQHDYQCWIERVDSSGRVGIVIEDGEVAADHQQPEPSTAATAA